MSVYGYDIRSNLKKIRKIQKKPIKALKIAP
jgi:hypothetical protein